MENLKIGYFEHWSQPEYKFVDFLKEQGVKVTKIDYSQKGYLENFDVALIEQNGFNDYIENDERYIQDWVKRGGIVLFMHQDYMRFAPYFLPLELGYVQLIHRYVGTLGGAGKIGKHFSDIRTPYKTYMMPWIEDCGKRLFSEPEVITPDQMIGWQIKVNGFGQRQLGVEDKKPETVITAADSCYLLPDGWEVIGSYMDPAVRDGALIARAKYGDGMYFLNQLFFPEVKPDDNDRCLNFWKKYVKNLFAYLLRFKNGQSEVMPAVEKTLPIKKNYKLAIHMHSLDWYGCDAAPGTINAMMRYMGFDICAVSIRDSAPYKGKLSTEKYSDDKVLFLDGQEYHPFNWNDRFADKSHNTYHMVTIGTNPEAYTTKFTKSLFSEQEIDEYLKEAIDYVHKNNGVVCATHPYGYYFDKYDFDAVDVEPMQPLSGTNMEKYYLDGGKCALMNSVDLFGFRRILNYPAANFIYLNGKTPCRDSVVEAIKKRHVIAATGFDQADITLGEYLPGDIIDKDTAKNLTLKISAKIFERGNIKQVRVYSADKVIWSTETDAKTVDFAVELKNFELEKFVRVEIEGEASYWICNSTPFFLK